MLTRLLITETSDARFVAPDVGPGRTPYACTFHWMRTADGRVIGMDVIRSDDLGRRGLRVFVFEPTGAVRALVHEAPTAAWAPFTTDARPPLDGAADVVARGPGWVAGSVSAPGQSLPHVRFALDVTLEAPGLKLRPPLGRLLRLEATDYLHARTRGFIELDGDRLEIDAPGPLSIHHGLRLTRYAYVAAIPAGGGDARLIAATVAGDTLRVGGSLLGGRAVTYAYAAGFAAGAGAPLPRALHLGRPTRDLSLGGGRRLLIDEIHAFPHTLLGEPTVTAIARGRLADAAAGGGALTLVLDNRGAPFSSLLAPSPGSAAAGA